MEQLLDDVEEAANELVYKMDISFAIQILSEATFKCSRYFAEDNMGIFISLGLVNFNIISTSMNTFHYNRRPKGAEVYLLLSEWRDKERMGFSDELAEAALF